MAIFTASTNMYSFYIQRGHDLYDKVNSHSFGTFSVLTSYYNRVNISMDMVVNKQFCHPIVEKNAYQPDEKPEAK